MTLYPTKAASIGFNPSQVQDNSNTISSSGQTQPLVLLAKPNIIQNLVPQHQQFQPQNGLPAFIPNSKTHSVDVNVNYETPHSISRLSNFQPPPQAHQQAPEPLSILFRPFGGFNLNNNSTNISYHQSHNLHTQYPYPRQYNLQQHQQHQAHSHYSIYNNNNNSIQHLKPVQHNPATINHVKVAENVNNNQIESTNNAQEILFSLSPETPCFLTLTLSPLSLTQGGTTSLFKPNEEYSIYSYTQTIVDSMNSTSTSRTFFNSNLHSTIDNDNSTTVSKPLRVFLAPDISPPSSHWLSHLWFLADGVMRQTGTHIQVLPLINKNKNNNQSSSSPTTVNTNSNNESSHDTFNVTISGSFEAAQRAREMLLNSGSVYKTTCVLRLPFMLEPLLADSLDGGLKSKIEELALMQGVLVFWKATPYDSHLNPIYSKSSSSSSDCSSSVLIILKGSLEAVERAKLSLLHLFDSHLGFSLQKHFLLPKQSFLSPERQIASLFVASGPKRRRLFEWMAELDVKIYLPSAIDWNVQGKGGISGGSGSDLSSPLGSPMLLQKSLTNSMHQLLINETTKGEQEGSSSLNTSNHRVVHITAQNEAVLGKIMDKLASLSNSLVAGQDINGDYLCSKQFSVSRWKLSALVTEQRQSLEKLLYEHGLYLCVCPSPSNPKSIHDSSHFNAQVCVTIYGGKVYIIDTFIETFTKWLCVYQAAAIQVTKSAQEEGNSRDDVTLDAVNDGHMLKFEKFPDLVQQLRAWAVQFSGLDVIYGDDKIAIFGRSYCLIEALASLSEQVSMLSSSGALGDSTIIWEAPNSEREFVCGKKDGKLLKVMRTSGTLINIDSGPSEWSMSINLTGPTLKHVLDGMGQVMGELPAETSFHIPESHHKRIIGHGGKNIQKIMKNYGVYVKFLNGDEVLHKYRGRSSSSSFHGIERGGSGSDFEAPLNNVVVKTPAKNSPSLEQMKKTLKEISGEHEERSHMQESLPIPSAFHVPWLIHQQNLKDVACVGWAPLEWAEETLFLEGQRKALVRCRDLLLKVIPKAICLKRHENNKIVFSEEHSLKLKNIVPPCAKMYSMQDGQLTWILCPAFHADEIFETLLKDPSLLKCYSILDFPSTGGVRSNNIIPVPAVRSRSSSFRLESNNHQEECQDKNQKAGKSQFVRPRAMSLGAFEHFNSVLLSNVNPFVDIISEEEEEESTHSKQQLTAVTTAAPAQRIIRNPNSPPATLMSLSQLSLLDPRDKLNADDESASLVDPFVPLKSKSTLRLKIFTTGCIGDKTKNRSCSTTFSSHSSSDSLSGTPDGESFSFVSPTSDIPTETIQESYPDKEQTNTKKIQDFSPWLSSFLPSSNN